MALTKVEQLAVEDFQEQRSPENGLEVNDENLISVGIQVALKMGELLQRARVNISSIQFYKKTDGSRVTNIDKNAEILAREMIEKVFPDHLVVGEEQGGIVDPGKYTWVIDPIDSTNAFLSHENTSGISICLFKEGIAALSVVYNPFTGELYYASGNNRSRLIRQYGFSKVVAGDDLPLRSIEEESVNFVNVHPVLRNFPILKKLRRALSSRDIDKLLQTGGSPAFGLASITKGGYFTTVYNWGEKEADPWDLAAGVHIVRNAGGIVTDTQNKDVELVGHKGILIASINRELHDLVLKIINQPEIG